MDHLPFLILTLLVGALYLARTRRQSSPRTAEPLPAMPDPRRVPFAGFWQRFPALLIDGLVFLPPFVVAAHIESYSRDTALVVPIVVGALPWVYEVYFHGRWGATLGKMAMRVRVVRAEDQGAIWYRAALLRSSVGIALAILGSAAHASALSSISNEEYRSVAALSVMARASKLAELRPQWGILIGPVSTCWFWSEVVVMLLNRKRQALHDMIAGTVVVRVPKVPEIQRIDGPVRGEGERG